MTTPYVPLTGPPSAMQPTYRSVAQVLRLSSTLQAGGGMSVTWAPITDVVDLMLGTPGMLSCRLDIGFIRPGKDQPAPLVAGRAPDRVGVAYYDPVVDASSNPLVKSGDRLLCVSGPIFGMFAIHVVPDVAQDWIGAHHVEVQVIEVAQALLPGSPTPFPGSRP
jgi:hypothetical protein